MYKSQFQENWPLWLLLCSRVTNVFSDAQNLHLYWWICRVTDQPIVHMSARRDSHLRVEGECFGSLGSTTDGYGSKMMLLRGDSRAARHMATSRSTTWRWTSHNIYSTNTKPQHTRRMNGARDAPQRRWPPPQPLRTSLPACRRKTHTALSCKPRAGGKKPTNQSKEPSFSREQQLTLTFSMDPFWKTCCSSHTTQYFVQSGDPLLRVFHYLTEETQRRWSEETLSWWDPLSQEDQRESEEVERIMKLMMMSEKHTLETALGCWHFNTAALLNWLTHITKKMIKYCSNSRSIQCSSCAKNTHNTHYCKFGDRKIFNASAHQGCIYLIKNTVKMWNIIAI